MSSKYRTLKETPISDSLSLQFHLNVAQRIEDVLTKPASADGKFAPLLTLSTAEMDAAYPCGFVPYAGAEWALTEVKRARTGVELTTAFLGLLIPGFYFGSAQTVDPTVRARAEGALWNLLLGRFTPEQEAALDFDLACIQFAHKHRGQRSAREQWQLVGNAFTYFGAEDEEGGPSPLTIAQAALRMDSPLWEAPETSGASSELNGCLPVLPEHFVGATRTQYWNFLVLRGLILLLIGLKHQGGVGGHKLPPIVVEFVLDIIAEGAHTPDTSPLYLDLALICASIWGVPWLLGQEPQEFLHRTAIKVLLGEYHPDGGYQQEGQIPERVVHSVVLAVAWGAPQWDTKQKDWWRQSFPLLYERVIQNWGRISVLLFLTSLAELLNEEQAQYIHQQCISSPEAEELWVENCPNALLCQDAVGRILRKTSTTNSANFRGTVKESVYRTLSSLLRAITHRFDAGRACYVLVEPLKQAEDQSLSFEFIELTRGFALLRHRIKEQHRKEAL